MRSKIFYSIFTAAMVIFLLSLFLILSVLYNYYSDKYSEELRNEALYLSTAVEIGSADMLDTLSEDISGRITLISAAGDVIFDNLTETEKPENYSELEEFILAEKNGVGESSRYSIAHGAQLSYCAVKLSDGSIIRVSSAQYTVLTLIIDMITPVIFIFAVAIVLSLILAARLSSSITDPINEIDLDAPDSRDVYSEIRPLIEKIHEQNREIDRQMKAIRAEHDSQDAFRREFTANVSHELKTPLTTISGAAELLSAGFVKQEDIPRFAENIYSEAKRLITLVNDIMELSRLDENAIPEKTNVDLYALGNEVMNSLGEAAGRESVKLSLEGVSTLIVGVPKVIYEMIYNLCDNAIKYNKVGGSVTITAGRDDGVAFVSVRDTGIGIPEDEKGRIFERFYRVDKSHSREVGGTGLGLSIVKHGAILHDAKIDLESTLGEGTTVKISFPKA